MHLQFLLFTLAYLAAPVIGGGYQGCLERVLAFQGYEIDGQNPVADQIMGFRCDRWNDNSKQCDGKWVTCAGSKPGGRCNYEEFLRHLGKLPNEKSWAVYQAGSTSRLDATASAKRCLYIYQTKGQGKGVRVRNFPPWQVMKNGNHIFSDFIKKQARLVDETAKNHKNPGNSDQYNDFDNTRGQLVVSRAGDHGEYLVKEAKAKLGGKMTVYPMNLGPNPNDPSKTLETVDWKATADAAKKAGVPNYATEIFNFRQNFYHAKNSDGKRTPDAKAANDHRVVINLYQRGEDRSRRCR